MSAQARADLLEAMATLHHAHAHLDAGNLGDALVQLDKAAAILAEVRKQILSTKHTN